MKVQIKLKNLLLIIIFKNRAYQISKDALILKVWGDYKLYAWESRKSYFSIITYRRKLKSSE